MPSTFTINHLKKGIELQFETRTDRIPLFKKTFAEVAEGNEFIRKLKAEIKPKQFCVYMSKKRKYTFEVRCIDGNQPALRVKCGIELANRTN